MPRSTGKPPLTHEQRSMNGRIGAYAMHAKVTDPTAHTAPARQEFDARFEREVDPEGTLPPEERARRAAFARRAYFLRLSLRSAQVRRARRGAA